MRNERGTAFIELAVVTPLLIMLTMGVADFGRALSTHVAIRDAAQEGVRFGASQPADADEIVHRVIANTKNPLLGPSNVQVTCSEVASPELAVTVEYDIEFITPIASLFGSGMTLEATERSTVFSDDACAATP